MKKTLSNIPGVRLWYYFFKALGYKIKNKQLRVGYATNITKSNFGSNVSVGSGTNLLRVDVGDFSYISDQCNFRDVKIGKFCSIASDVKCGMGFHPIHFVSTHPAFYSNENQNKISFSATMKFKDHTHTHIGNDVWIGANVFILDGVRIGNGAVVSAGSIVTKDIEDYEIVGGVPAKHIKYRFSENIRKKINESAWWNWDSDKLKKEKELFLDTEAFINSIIPHESDKIQ